MKVYLHSIGCRLNQSEMENLARQLLAAGHQIVPEPEAADQVVINTCAVTRAAARDGRRLTRRFHRDNETADIWLTGCYATIAPEKLSRIQGASHIVPNADKDRLIRLLDPAADEEIPVYDQEPVLREFLAGSSGNTRAFVKVQDGCDNRCTFCVTTIARGRGRSRRLGDVVAEIQGLAEAGYREVVLTGVHLGSYGHDFENDTGLYELVKAVLGHSDIPRLRLSSLEPWDLSPDFFTLWENERLLPHLHLPLQSGSDSVLRRMARRTSRAEFRALVKAARAAIPDLNLSTDLIAGFPGETEAEFAETEQFVAEMAFARLHVFTYSPRPGTAAARMPEQLPKQKRKARTRQLIELGHEMSHAFHREFVGETRPVLWETAVGGNGDGLRWVGYTDNYIRVNAAGPSDLSNRITPVYLQEAHSDFVEGEICFEAGR